MLSILKDTYKYYASTTEASSTVSPEENKSAQEAQQTNTHNKVDEQRSQISALSATSTSKNKNTEYSKVDLSELLRLRDSYSPTSRKEINRELVQRLNRYEIPFQKLGIHKYVFEKTSIGAQKLKPLISQIYDFFEECCSEIHHLNLAYSGTPENGFVNLKHFHGLHELDVSHTDFKELWVLDLMPNLESLIMENCYNLSNRDILEFKRSDKYQKIAYVKITSGYLGMNP